MKYAIVAAAWLTTWGAFAPQDAGAGFVLCVDGSMSAAVPLQDTLQNAVDPAAPSPSGDTMLVFDSVLGVIEVPSGAQAPSHTQQTRVTMQACGTDSVQQSLCQSTISSRLPLNLMFSPRMMYKSAVFRPPRA